MTFAVDENGFITAGQELPDGSADLFETDPEAVADVIGQSGYELPVSAGDAVPASGAYAAYGDVAAMSDGIMLLASDSAAANGYLSSTILDLMDRIVDGYGSDYEYLGFRTSQDDSYSAVLYIGLHGSGSGDMVSFEGDVVQVTFARTGSNYDYVPYFNISSVSDLTVSLASRSVVYTDCLPGRPTLGSRTVQDFPAAGAAMVLFAVVLAAVFLRRRPRG